MEEQGSGSSWYVRVGWAPSAAHLWSAKYSNDLLPLDLFVQTNFRCLAGFSDIFNFRFSNSF